MTPNLTDVARRLLATFDAGGQIEPLSDADPDLTLAQAYGIAAEIHHARLARGEIPAGRKIGFTNRTIWDTYNVSAPVWGWIYEGGLRALSPDDGPTSLPDLPDLRIEPEIAFRIAQEPSAQMTDAELAACIDGVAHAFELVFSVYPKWRFCAPDTAAAFGMHAGLLLGPFHEPEAFLKDAGKPISNLAITLDGPGVSLAGHGFDVLGGPLQALRHLLRELAATPGAASIRAGEIVSTGTLTDAAPIRPGETWRTCIQGVPLSGLSVTFADA
jgi:2-oxo-3-hexenedioate decarboxylase